MKRHAWLLGPSLVALITITSLTGAGLLIYHAHADPSFAVEADYYNKAVHWDAEAAQERRNAELGWVVEVETLPGDQGAPSRLRLTLEDAEGRAISDARVSVEAFHNARAADRRTLTLSSDSAGAYGAVAAFEREGLWEFRVTAHRGDEVFTAVLQRMVAGRAAPEVRP